MDTLPAIIPSDAVQIIHPVSTGLLANQHADQTAHNRYTDGKSDNTLRRQKADLHLFFQFLLEAHYEYPIQNFFALSESGYSDEAWTYWQGVTYGLVEAYIEWQKQQGYSIGSIGVHLSTVKAYCKLANRAGAIDHMNLASILMVKSPTHKEGIHIDKKRLTTRIGSKKAEATHISPAHAILLKQQKRLKDVAIMCLLLDLGLRCGELVSLKVSDIDLPKAMITFYREKVDITQTHRLTPDCLKVLQAYIPTVKGQYLFTGHKGAAMTTTGINKRVGELGLAVGIAGLSPHDCRHYLFTEEMRKGTDTKTLQSMGGWSSPAMALKYANNGSIANDGASFFASESSK